MVNIVRNGFVYIRFVVNILRNSIGNNMGWYHFLRYLREHCVLCTSFQCTLIVYSSVTRLAKYLNHTFWCSAEQYLDDILFNIISPRYVRKRLQNSPATTTRLKILATRLSTSSTSRLAPFILRAGRCLLPISVTLVVPFALNALAFLEFAHPGVVCTGVDRHGERLHACPDWVGRTKRCNESLIGLVDVKGVDVEQRRRFAEALVIWAIKNFASLLDPGEMLSQKANPREKNLLLGVWISVVGLEEVLVSVRASHIFWTTVW